MVAIRDKGEVATSAVRSDLSGIVSLAIKESLGQVLRLFPRAAIDYRENAEFVHQLRVSIRRATAVIKFFKTFLPRRMRRRLLKRLDQLRRAAGPARDLDILYASVRRNLGNKFPAEFDSHLVKLRAEAQAPLLEVYNRWDEGSSLECCFHEAVNRVGARRDGDKNADLDCRSWLDKRLKKLLHKFARRVPTRNSDLDEFHQFRLRGKDVRYAMYAIDALVSDVVNEELHLQIKRLLDRLGKLNDSIATEFWIKRAWRRATDESAAAPLEAAYKVHRAKRKLVVTRFRKWWSKKRRAKLIASLTTKAPIKP